MVNKTEVCGQRTGNSVSPYMYRRFFMGCTLTANLIIGVTEKFDKNTVDVIEESLCDFYSTGSVHSLCLQTLLQNSSPTTNSLSRQIVRIFLYRHINWFKFSNIETLIPTITYKFFRVDLEKEKISKSRTSDVESSEKNRVTSASDVKKSSKDYVNSNIDSHCSQVIPVTNLRTISHLIRRRNECSNKNLHRFQFLGQHTNGVQRLGLNYQRHFTDKPKRLKDPGNVQPDWFYEIRHTVFLKSKTNSKPKRNSIERNVKDKGTKRDSRTEKKLIQNEKAKDMGDILSELLFSSVKHEVCWNCNNDLAETYHPLGRDIYKYDDISGRCVCSHMYVDGEGKVYGHSEFHDSNRYELTMVDLIKRHKIKLERKRIKLNRKKPDPLRKDGSTGLPVTEGKGGNEWESLEMECKKFTELEAIEYGWNSRTTKEKFYELKFPYKLPPLKGPLPVIKLPMLGYLEQTCATYLIKALTSCGDMKPKYPFLSPTRSAILHIAYYLKANNPKASEHIRKRYKKKLQQFEATCCLIKYLADNMPMTYTSPVHLPQDFQQKLDLFLALKGIEPTKSWII